VAVAATVSVSVTVTVSEPVRNPGAGIRGPESGVRGPAASTRPSESGHGLGLGHGLRLGLGHRSGIRCPVSGVRFRPFFMPLRVDLGPWGNPPWWSWPACATGAASPRCWRERARSAGRRPGRRWWPRPRESNRRISGWTILHMGVLQELPGGHGIL